MASVVTATNTAYQRSHSSPNLPDLASYEFKHKQAADKSDELPRSASYTCLPILESLSYAPENDPLRGLSDSLLPELSRKETHSGNKLGEDGESNIGASRDERPRLGRTRSLVSRPKSWIQRAVNSSPHRRDVPEHKAPPLPRSIPAAKAIPDKAKNPPESFATFARKTWISTSRSPSPNNRLRKKNGDDSTVDGDESSAPSSVTSSSPRKSSPISSRSDEIATDVTSTSPANSSTWKFKSIHRKSILQAGHVKVLGHKAVNISDTSLPGSLSEKESSAGGSTDGSRAGKTFPKEKLAVFGAEATRKKDELWPAFRSLELDYQKFQAKSNGLKTNVVRSTLLPFLRNYAQHASNKFLRPEDLDRRTAILNKWWMGLLEMLDGHNNQYVSGVDRPVILEAVTAIMIRPEWRLAPSNFAPLADRNTTRELPRPRSSSSLSSGTSQFLAESVYHNIRNMFIQNLLSQMSLVVDKMSLRTAPASLVTFCGKAAAYAFFFCPGVAEILVRIWNIPPDTIRRVVDEFGLVRRPHGNNNVDEIVVEFPPSLHPMGWKSSKTLITQLRQRLVSPPTLARVYWYGPWISRWCGRDSDLFFVFCKHYHILLEEFLPPALPLVEKARSPGFVLVHAQILTALDATIHRQPSNDAAAAVLAMSFDDVISDADASAAALPLPPSSNATRLMAENRLIMLLRDFLSERPSETQCARHTFAEAFSTTMSATARKTSQFNHNACFILCDFMEEALTIYLRFQNALDMYVEYINWAFWYDVCQKMLESENTMTEIRLFSFIFGAWNMIVADDKRKEVLSFEWILTEDTFRKYFLHWCPMVRAYYMRLLCWRVCRFDGESSQLDIKVFGTAFDRLKGIWSNYLYQKEDAENKHTVPPSIAPSHPAPGRRLLIIRNDNQIPAAALFLGFDGIVQPFSTNQSTAYKRHSSLASIAHSNSTDFNVAADPPANSKKRWSLLGKIMPFSSSDGPGHGPNSSPQSQHKVLTPLEQARQATASARMRAPLQTLSKKSSTSSLTSLDDSRPSSPTHRPFSFKFSLEWTTPPHVQQDLQSSKSNKNLHTLQLNGRLSAPRLPAPAHTFLVGTVPGTANEVISKPLKGPEAKYAGRALAEWAIIVKECNSFIERRKTEGVPCLKVMEVPTLGVEGFRKYC